MPCRRNAVNSNVPIRYKQLLGYERGDDNKPKIIPEEAETVRLIYKRYLDGLSLSIISDELITGDYKNALGTTDWNPMAVKRILENEKYCGCALLQKTYVVDCISKQTRKNTGELPMYFITNNHEPIVSKEVFDRVREETAKRFNKKKALWEHTNSIQGKYSAKYALSEILICAECGTLYRRVTWTAKGFKEYKWRCVNRLQNGKKYCKHSPTIEEDVLHAAIITAINKFISIKNEVADMLEQNIREVLNPNFTETITNAEKRINDIQRITMELVSACTVNSDAEKHTEEFERFKNETDGLREFIRHEKARINESNTDNSKIEYILEILRNADFDIKEYDDVVVRHLIEGINVLSKDKILIVFKGGFELEQRL